MRTRRIFSLLFSLCQFLLFLKFIEMVRGDPLPLPKSSETIRKSLNASELDTREQRHFFVAPRVKERKFKPWLSSTSTTEPSENATTTDSSSYVDEDGTIKNVTYLDRSGITGTEKNSTASNENSASGRLCPGCEGGNCGATAVSAFGFPVIPLIIALVLGVLWFIVFLFLFYFMIDPAKTQPAAAAGYPPSSGGSMSSSSHGGGGIGSIFNFLTGDQRSLDNFNSLTSTVTETLFNLARKYHDL